MMVKTDVIISISANSIGQAMILLVLCMSRPFKTDIVVLICDVIMVRQIMVFNASFNNISAIWWQSVYSYCMPVQGTVKTIDPRCWR